jgi:translation initiation factor 3 subunit J
MTDHWDDDDINGKNNKSNIDDDDDDDDWDVDDDALDAKLGLKNATETIPVFENEEDLTLAEKSTAAAQNHEELRIKGNALFNKKLQEEQRKAELELARKVMELEVNIEQSLSPDEIRVLKQKQIEQADNSLTNDLFGAVDNVSRKGNGTATDTTSGDKLVFRDLMDHLRHAKKIGTAVRNCGNIHFARAFLKEVIQECAEVVDDDAITDIIKTCNVIKNDKVLAAKRKSKGQAQKSKKVDKVAEAKARKLQIETFGDNDEYDDIDQVGADYEDAFF